MDENENTNQETPAPNPAGDPRLIVNYRVSDKETRPAIVVKVHSIPQKDGKPAFEYPDVSLTVFDEKFPHFHFHTFVSHGDKVGQWS